MADPEPKTALIVGASRGLGLAMAAEYLERGWQVIGTVRAGGTGLHALAARAGDRLAIEPLDILDPAGIAALAKRLAGRRLDLLFVNAGVSDGPGETIAGASDAAFDRVLRTNALAPLRVLDALEGLVPRGGVIGAMSSGLGSVAGNTTGGWEVYRASKAALNTLVRSFAARHARDGRAKRLIAPGWVRTDMGGAGATLGIDESVPKVVDVLLAAAGSADLRFLDYRGEPVAW